MFESHPDTFFPTQQSRSRSRYLYRLVLLTALYYLAARLGLFLETGYGGVTPIWPPAGIAVAVMILGGPRYWPMILVGEFLVSLHLQQTVLTGLVGGAAQILEALVAYTLLGRKGSRLMTRSGQAVLRFTLYGAVIPPLIAASLGAGALWFGEHLSRPEAWQGFVTWWLGDAIGILVVAPILVGAFLHRPPKRGIWLRFLAFMVLFTAIGLALVIFGDERAYALLFVLVPFVVVAAIRFRLLGATGAILVMTCLVFRMRPEDLGGDDFITAVRMAFVGTSAFTGYLVTGFMTSRQQRQMIIGRQRAFVETLNKLMMGLVSRLDRDQLLDTIVTQACTLLETENGCFLKTDPRTGETVVLIGKGIYAPVAGYRVKSGVGLAGSVHEGSRPMVINDYQGWEGRHPDPIWDSVAAVLGVPILHADETVGVLCLVRTESGQGFDAQDLAGLEQFGKLASVAWNNALLYEDLAHQLEARVQAEKALVVSERTLRSIFNAVEAAIFVLDEGTGKILQANSAAEQLMAPREARGEPLFALLGGGMEPFTEDDGWQLLERCTWQADQSAEWRAVLPDGVEAWLEIVLRKARIGDTDRVLAEVRNIDERKEFETVRHTMAQTQKMEALGALAGGIAHDFNNILSAIIGFTELVLEYDLPEDHAAVPNLRQVLAGGHRATDLVRQILTFSRPSEVERRPVDVCLVAEDVLNLMSASLPPTVKIQLQNKASNAIVMSTQTHLHQVLMNLITNAAQALDEGRGTIIVDLSNLVIGEDAHPAGPEQLKAGEYLKMAVRDDGCGMDEETLARVFEPYFTTKVQGKGTGLGMALVHGLAHRMGGQARVESIPGVGTTITLLLPVVVVAEPGEEESALPLPRGEESVLFVDDNPLLTDLAQRFLGKLGYEVTVLRSSEVALATYTRNPGAFDLIITDLWMPGLTGIELCREMRRLREDIPIVMCTGNPENVTPEQVRELRIDRVVAKPLNLREFANLIREILGKKD